VGLSLRLFAGENSSVTFSPGREVLICRNVPHPGSELSHLSNMRNTIYSITVTDGCL